MSDSIILVPKKCVSPVYTHDLIIVIYHHQIYIVCQITDTFKDATQTNRNRLQKRNTIHHRRK